jgi:hypothetical protein
MPFSKPTSEIYALKKSFGTVRPPHRNSDVLEEDGNRANSLDVREMESDVYLNVLKFDEQQILLRKHWMGKN